MIELELLGVGADGESLVLTDADGQRYTVPVTDELRAATRRGRPRPEPVDPNARGLRPRDIQALLRSGLTAEDISREYSVDIQHVRRFEAPVLAEQQWALARARDSHVGGERDAPVMGDLVVDRLAARGVSPDTLSWSARREADGPWEITLTFVQGAAEHAAHWTLAPSATSVEAADQEARWLTETVTRAAAPTVLAALPVAGDSRTAPDEDRAADEGAGEDDSEARAREALLDQLNAARGHRVPLDLGAESGPIQDDDAEDTGPIPSSAPGARASDEARPSISARIYSLAHARTAAHPSASAPAAGPHSGPAAAARPGPVPSDAAHSDTAEASGSGDDSPTTPEERPAPGVDQPIPGLEPGSGSPSSPRPHAKKRSRRRSVPSWEEIVFGSRQ